MTQHARKFSGLIAPLATAFNTDGSVDIPRTVALGQFLMQNGCSGLAPLGTTSEANSISYADRKKIVEALIAGGIEPSRLMPGTGCTSVDDTADLSRHALEAGAGGVLVLPPFYFPEPSEDGLFAWYDALIKKTGERQRWLFFYNIPKFSTVTITPALIDRVREANPDAVGGLKDFTGDWNSVLTFLEAFPDLDVFPSSEAVLVQSLEKGAAGTITAGANTFPQMIGKLYAEWSANRETDELQAKVTQLRTALQAYELIPAVKTLLAHMHDDPQWLRLAPPLTQLSAASQSELKGEIDRLLAAQPADAEA